MQSIDASALEAAIVRNAAPTITGIMPANLFTFPGHFVAANTQYSSDSTTASESTITAASEAHTAREALIKAVINWNTALTHTGIELTVLVWRSCGALILIYRRNVLERFLAQTNIQRALKQAGYPSTTLDACLGEMAKRLAARGKWSVNAYSSNGVGNCLLGYAPREQNTCENCTHLRCAFPHEIGYFLGYPPHDVESFITEKGKNFRLLGPWKVYHDIPRAAAMFARIRQCTNWCKERYQRGDRLHELVQAYV
ncbi:DUF3793 family protein [Collinsella sp. zg1085]|uniref:DUF3793 family protein n=1 Tax=Collinsella sp. zg1085 TaxID=2844380 RepID=UPI001C0D7DF5|nr:DUF3793 family protein [Collinsella sp. zg1085]QWT18171.1 DUF3793 family protein [Collinsella sp. zg1085]